MNKKNKKSESKTKVINFIHFLKKEFGLGGFGNLKTAECKIAHNIKNEKIMAKENFHKIGKLIDDALKHLPDIENEAADHDEKHANKWNILHAKTKKELHDQIFPKIHSDIYCTGSKIKKENTFSYNWKTLSLEIALIMFILLNCFLCVKPNAIIKTLAFADKIINSRPQTSEQIAINNIMIPELNKLGLSQSEIAAAKALYILRNQERIKNRQAMEVSAKDLFGSKVQASEDIDYGRQEAVKQNKLEIIVDTIKISWVNFFKGILYGK